MSARLGGSTRGFLETRLGVSERLRLGLGEVAGKEGGASVASGGGVKFLLIGERGASDVDGGGVAGTGVAATGDSVHSGGGVNLMRILLIGQRGLSDPSGEAGVAGAEVSLARSSGEIRRRTIIEGRSI
jgi:hypothetical protein